MSCFCRHFLTEMRIEYSEVMNVYRCLSLGRIIKKLTAAAIAAAVCAVLFAAGRAVSKAAMRIDEKPVPLPVIMYHSVCEKEPSDYIITPSQLEADLSWLDSHGYTAVSAQQLISYTRNSSELPEKPVLITFDDGFYNNLSIALPLLEKYDMCAVVSIVGRYTDDYAAADPHENAYSYLTWQDVSELASSGRTEIGSHTYDLHSNSDRHGCAKLPDESTGEYASMLETDIELLKTKLKANCGTVPSVFAYPFGSMSRESLPVLRKSGILMTLTCREGMNLITRDPDCLYGIFRYNRSGLLNTEEYMKKITEKLPEE